MPASQTQNQRDNLQTVVTRATCACRIFLVFFLLGIVQMPASAQQPFFKHYTVDDGLPSNEVYGLLEDTSGYLMMATDRGVARFDGYTFETLFLDQKSTVTPVYDIYQSRSGALYFPGLKGEIYQYASDILFPHNQKIATSDNSAGFLIADAIAPTNDGLLVKYNNNTPVVLRVSGNGRVQQEPVVHGIHFDLMNGISFNTRSDGRMQGIIQPVFITWPDGRRSVDTVRVRWPGGYIRKPFHLAVKGVDVFCIGRQILLYRDRKKLGEALLPADALCLRSTPTGELLIGFRNGGVGEYRINGTTISGPHRSYLAPLSVSGIHRDFQGGYWYATLDDGVFYAYPSGAAFSVDDSRVVFMVQQRDTAFVGHADGEIFRLHHGVELGKLVVPLKSGEELLGASFSLDGKLIATSNLGSYWQRGASWYRAPGADRVLIQASSETAYGAGIENAVLHRYTLADPSTKSIALPKRILSMVGDGEKSVWLGTIEGLYHYSLQSGLRYVGGKLPALADRIVSLKRLANGWLAIATLSSGLVLQRGNQTKILNSANGLITPIINDMQVGDSSIWLSTNKGLTEIVLDGDRISAQHYGSNYGLPTLDVDVFAVSGGWLYMKWINSTAAIELRRLKTLQPSRGAFITGAKVTSATIRSGQSIANDRNNVLFAFNSINFACGDNQQYRCRLFGFDQQWHFTNDRQASYTNLSPGRYTFVVQVAGEGGRFGRTHAAWPFRILPAYWQRWWFIALCIGVGVALVALLFRARLRTVRKRNQLQLDLAESQQKALVQLISPHFLFNMLNTAQSSILGDDKIKAASLIARIARLMRLSLEVSKERYVPMEKEIDLLEKYTELEMLRVPGKFRCEISVSPSVNSVAIKIPGMLIQPFVENAIKHGVMHLRDRPGFIAITIETSDELLLCSVTDNGIGREAAAALQTVRSSTHHSMGMEITRRRLKLLHRDLKTDFFFEVADAANTRGAVRGTRVTFSLPYQVQS